MADDRRLTISSARLHADEVARHTFATARRGFETAEVRAYLEIVADELALAAQRERELRELLAEAEHRAANPVLDEATLSGALGQETARVLRSAHDAAAEVTARAEAEAGQLRDRVHQEAAHLRERAEQAASERTSQAEAAAAAVTTRAHEEATGSIEKARLESEALLAQARAECRAMVQEAQQLRTKVLADLKRRRIVLHSQIEQLRAGRERLAETITGVRNAVDVIADELFRAEDEARLAAEEAGRQVAAQAADVHDGGGSESAGVTADVTAAEADDGLDEEARKQAVEDLFARLRAENGSAGGHQGGEPVLEAPDGHGGGSAPPASPASEVSEVESEVVVLTAVEGGDEVPVAVEAAVDPDLARRDEMLRPLITALTRRLKRALQDDQNDILHRLRGAGGWGPEVLPPLSEHEARYAGAAAEHLRQAAGSGASFGGGKVASAPPVDVLADELASAIVAPLRRRLDSAGVEVDTGDDALVERVGGAFREWKGARVERLAGDQALAAFSRGTLAVVPAGTTMRWVVDDGGMECPDCDDNALAGPTGSGQEFPTGHRHPPAHAGCRCLIVPATT
jgi:DivIVA domain-containing protein